MEKKGTKILILIIILALLGGAIYFIVQKNNNVENNTSANLEAINNVKHFVFLGDGYDTKYNGLDRLFSGEPFTKNDLTNGIMLTAAYRFIADPKNNIDATITPQEYANLEEGYDLEDAKVYKGKDVRDAIKVLFGIDYKDDGFSSMSYKYEYIYDGTTDMYIMKTKTNSADDKYSVLPLVVGQDKKGSTIVTKVAIAYTVKDGNKYKIYSNVSNTELVKEVKEISLEEFTKEEKEKLPKYNITCKDVDGNYTFEKIEAVK